MTRKCIIKGCTSRSGSPQHRGVTFHSFPFNNDKRKIWLNNCRLNNSENKSLTKNAFVCSRHFRRIDFQTVNKTNKFLLKQGSVPTIFPWGKIQSESESNQNKSNDNNDEKESEDSNVMEISKISENDTKTVQTPVKRPHNDDNDDDTANENASVNKIPKHNVSYDDLSQSTVTTGISDNKSCIIGSPTSIISSHPRKSDSNTSNTGFTLGNKIEAQDFNGIWHTAKVVEVDSDEREVLIRFEKSKKSKGGGVEEWIPMNSSRLRQITLQISKKSPSVFEMGEKCMAKWSGPRKFPATISKVLGNDSYEVLFDDGYMKVVKGHHITKIKQKNTTKKSPTTTPTKTKSSTKKDWPLISISSLNLEELDLPDIPKDGEWCCYWVNDQPIGQEGFLMVGDHKKPTVIVEDWRLPPNWIKHMYQRSNVLGKWDVILVNPQGKRFRSRADLKQYIEELGQVYNPDVYDFSIHRRRAKDIGAYVFTKDYKPPPPPVSSSQQYFASLQAQNSENTTLPQISTPFSSPNTSEASSAPKDDNPTSNKLTEEEKSTVEDGYVHVGSLKVQIVDNLFRCPQEGCNKNFRKENHLQIHVKHYHRELAKLLGVCPNMQDLACKRTIGTSDSEPLPKNHLPNVQFFAKLHQQELANKTHRKSTLTPTTSITSPSIPSRNLDTQSTVESNKKDHSETSSTPAHVPETIKSTDTENFSTPSTSKNKPILDCFTPSSTEQKQSSSIITSNEDYTPTPTSTATPQLKTQEQKPTTIGKMKKSTAKDISGSNRKSSRQKLTKKYIQSRALTSNNNSNSVPETSITNSDQEETRHSFNGNNSTTEIIGKASSPLKKYKPEPLFIASEANLDATSQSQTTGSVQESSQSPKYINENGEIIKIVRMRQEEIINCLCSYGEEDGLMIQCELCLCWQHGICNGIEKESQVPEKYICYICRNPQRGRASLKYIHDQDWMYEGKLPVANYHAPSPDLEERFEILRKTHILTGNLLELKKFMHSLKVKINIAENKDHPKMYLWTNKWETSPIKENTKSEELGADEGKLNENQNADNENENENKNEGKNDDQKETKKTNNDDDNTTDNELKTNKNENVKEGCEKNVKNIKQEDELNESASIMKQPTIPQPEAPIDPVECQRRLLEHIKNQQLCVMDRLQTIESQIIELESLDDSEITTDTNDYSKTKDMIAMYIKDLEIMKNIAKINTVQVQPNFAAY